MACIAAILIPGIICLIAVHIQSQQAKEDQNKAAELYRRILFVLDGNPANPQTQAEVWQLFGQMVKPNHKAYSGPFYRLVLDILVQHPECIPYRVFALEAGRFHFGLQRPDGNVTIYDEQSIQNDIIARSGTSLRLDIDAVDRTQRLPSAESDNPRSFESERNAADSIEYQHASELEIETPVQMEPAKSRLALGLFLVTLFVITLVVANIATLLWDRDNGSEPHKQYRADDSEPAFGSPEHQRRELEKQTQHQAAVDAFNEQNLKLLRELGKQTQHQAAAGRPKENRYRDSHGAVATESEVENQLSELRLSIASMPEGAKRAYMTGMLRALEEEWARIKRQGPIDE